MSVVPDRGNNLARKIPTVSGTRFIAKCGHEDLAAHLSDTICENCTAEEKLKKNKETKKRIKQTQKLEMMNSFMRGR